MSDDDATPYCINRCGPAVGERINGMAGEDEVVDLMCADCLIRCTCTGVGLRTMLARLTGEVRHAKDCPRG